MFDEMKKKERKNKNAACDPIPAVSKNLYAYPESAILFLDGLSSVSPNRCSYLEQSS